MMTYGYFIYLYSSLRPVTTLEVAVADGFGDVHGFYFFAARLARLRRGYVAERYGLYLTLYVDAVEQWAADLVCAGYRPRRW